MGSTIGNRGHLKNWVWAQGRAAWLEAGNVSTMKSACLGRVGPKDIFRIAAILLVVLMPAMAGAASVSATVDRNQIAPGESVNLQISIQDGQGSVDVSAIQDFKVLSRGTNTSVKIINGQTTREVIYNYTLLPVKEGRLQIPSLAVRMDDQTLRTRAIVIQVARDPNKRTDPQDVFIESQLSRDNPFVGEQLTYTFRLFNAVQIANAQFQPPAFDGFTAQELEKRNNYRRVINGREYAVAEVIYILIPLASGSQTIEPAILQCDVVRTRRPSNRPRSFFDDRFFGRTQLEPRVLRTEPVPVTVRSLPENETPVSFSGLVGTFDLTAQLEPTTLKVGDSATLTLTLQGSGNIMDAQAPDIDLPETFKVYTDNPEEQITAGRNGYSGRKIFRVAIVPIQAGDHRLPTIRLNYFDTEQEKYVIRSTRPLALTVEPAALSDSAEVFKAPEGEYKSLKKQVEFTGRDILPLKQALSALRPQRAMPIWFFSVLIIAPVLVFGLVKLILLLTHKEATATARMAARAQKALKRAAGGNLPNEAFLSSLYQALTSAILSRADSMGASLTWKEAQDILTSTGYDPDLAQQAARLLEQIETSSYSGATLGIEETSQLLTATRKTIRSLLK